MENYMLIFVILVHFTVIYSCPSNCKCEGDSYHCCIGRDYEACSFPIAGERNASSSHTKQRCQVLIKSFTAEINGDLSDSISLSGSCFALRQFSIYGPNSIDGALTSEMVLSILNRVNESEQEYKNNLITFNVTGTKVNEIETGFSDRVGFQSLENIVINDNKNLETLSTGCFLGLKKIRRLYLRNNSISSFSLAKWGLYTIDSLILIDISANMIDRIENDAFANAKMVEEIYLDDNKISKIDAQVFNSLSRLRILSLKGNNLLFSSLTGFLYDPGPRQLILSNNPLTLSYDEWWLSKGCPKNLEHIEMQNIDLSSKMIEDHLRILDLSQCGGLRSIDFSQNIDIECLHGKWINLKTSEVIAKPLRLKPKNITFCNNLDEEEFRIVDGSPTLTVTVNTSDAEGNKASNLFLFNGPINRGRSIILIIILTLFILVVLITLFASFITCYRRQKQQVLLKMAPYSTNLNDNYTIQHNNINNCDIDGRNSLFGMNPTTASYVYCPSIEGSQQLISTLPKSPVFNGASTMYLNNNPGYMPELLLANQTFKPSCYDVVKEPDVDSLNCNDSGYSNSGKPSNSSKTDHQSELQSPKMVPVKMSNGTYQQVYFQNPHRKVNDANLSSSLISLSHPLRSPSPSTNSLLTSHKFPKSYEYYSPVLTGTIYSNGRRIDRPEDTGHDRNGFYKNLKNSLSYYQKADEQTGHNRVYGHEENAMAYSNMFTASFDKI